MGFKVLSISSRPILARFLILIFAFVAFIAFQLLALYVGPTVDKSGEVIVNRSEQSGPIVLSFSAQGIPTVAAKSTADQHFGLGYLHANDRLWQMELLRRQAGGRLSAIFGSEYVPVDRFSLTLNFYAIAQQHIRQLSPKSLQQLQAYRDGVNQWLETKHQLSFPFKYYDVNPELWTLEDSVAIFLLDQFRRGNGLFHTLGRWSQQAINPTVQPILGEAMRFSSLKNTSESKDELAADFSRMFLQTEHLTALFSDSSSDLQVYLSAAEQRISVEKSMSPLALTRWYFVNMSGANPLHGATLPGTPVFLLAESTALTWSILPSRQSGTEVRVERVSLANSHAFVTQTGLQSFDTRNHKISVRRATPELLYDALPDQPITVRYNTHGPLISDHISGLAVPVTVKSDVLNSTSHLLDAWLALPEAKTAKAVLAHFTKTAANTQRILIKSHSNQQPQVLRATQGHLQHWGLFGVESEALLPAALWRDAATLLTEQLSQSLLANNSTFSIYAKRLLSGLQAKEPLSNSMQALLFAWQQQLKQQFLQQALPISAANRSSFNWLYSRGLTWWAAVYQQLETTCDGTVSKSVCSVSLQRTFVDAVIALQQSNGDDVQQWGQMLQNMPSTPNAVGLPALDYFQHLTASQSSTQFSSALLFGENVEKFSLLHGSTLNKRSEFQWQSGVSSLDNPMSIENNQSSSQSAGVVFLALPQSERLFESLPENTPSFANAYLPLVDAQRVH